MMAVYHRKFGHTSVPNHHQQDVYRHTVHYSGPDDAKWEWESSHLDIPGSNLEDLPRHELAHRIFDQPILDKRIKRARTDAEQRFDRLREKGAKPDVYATAAAAYLDSKPQHSNVSPELSLIHISEPTRPY